MNVTHDKKQSNADWQTFWIGLSDTDGEASANAQFAAWLSLGFDDVGDWSTLSSYKRGKWTAAYEQAARTEALKLAIKSEPVKWLVKQDAEFDLYPFAWPLHTNATDIKITIDDANTAMLFKLTWGGRHYE